MGTDVPPGSNRVNEILPKISASREVTIWLLTMSNLWQFDGWCYLLRLSLSCQIFYRTKTTMVLWWWLELMVSCQFRTKIFDWDKISSIEYLVLKNISNPVRHGICHKWHLWKVFFQELMQKNYPICEISQIQAWVFSKQLEWICI